MEIAKSPLVAGRHLSDRHLREGSILSLMRACERPGSSATGSTLCQFQLDPAILRPRFR